MASHEDRNNNYGDKTHKKPGGWKAVPYILGNEVFATLAVNGMFANFLVYLTGELHIDTVYAANIMSIWSGLCNFGPLIGAFISDAYVGRFNTIAFASIPNLLGMMVVTLTAWLPELHPLPCTPQQLAQDLCEKPKKTHLLVLLLGFLLLSIGSSGIKPCSLPFGINQFDASTEEGRRGINSFFNWRYTITNLIYLVTQTVVMYIQDSVSWTLGFGIPTLCTLLALVFFFVGSRIYVHVEPDGSILSGVAQVLVAAYRKRKVELPYDEDEDKDKDGVAFYDPPLKKGTSVMTKLPLTNQFRVLNKAAIIMEGELNPDRSKANPWRLASIQQVEEVKCFVRILPIWTTNIPTLTSIILLGIFTISQALKMDRHLGPSFQIPAGSFSVFSFLTIVLRVPLYDRVLVPALRKTTHHEGGITLLQRMGIGLVFCVVSMVGAGFVEQARRGSTNSKPNRLVIAPMSAMWLAVPLILMGMCKAFYIIGNVEFLNRQCPEHMRSISNSLLYCSWGVASYVSTFIMTMVNHRTNWLTNDLNVGRLEYFYYLIAGLGAFNLGFFFFVAVRYQYINFKVQDDDDGDGDVELAETKASV
ncbi:protein NRT1/ PTR FAMILY 2.13-like [Neltuma alba]|uniref:protein NRT1/ PTR FAMILY 2.13-like n=1 Tax=Neltuma alba TaxID=207710 RepID=UPI0010A3FD25|nr:protein NRT1/ PTR FAMILY 2.13-like [Prosopis alba]